MAELPSGEPLSVIFLDTEGDNPSFVTTVSSSIALCSGFAASNISETYDAKIFSVATLLSSYLLYNSVKVVTPSVSHYLVDRWWYDCTIYTDY